MTGEYWHGTYNGYNNRGCRCDACRKAATVYQREWTHRKGLRKPWLDYLAEVDAEAAWRHGTEGTSKRCKCDECRAAAAAARAERRRRANPAKHGRTAYCNGCRCDVCRAAATAYSREYRARKGAAA